MKHLTVLITFIISTLVLSTAYAKSFTVIDATDNSPIIGATVITKSGLIKGTTDNYGNISFGDTKDLPATIRCMGYETAICSGMCDTIALNPKVYQLNEVMVSPTERPIIRIIALAREYSSGITDNDTLQLYCEYMAESFLADGKVKGYREIDARPTGKNARRYARIAKKNGSDTIFQPQRNDDISALSWFDFMAFIPNKKIEIPDAIKNGAAEDTIQGKFGPQFIFRKKNNIFTQTADALSNHKNRQWSPWLFKLLGMTVDINSAGWTMTFRANDNDSYGINEWISGSYNISMVGRGKWLKKAMDTKEPIEMNSYLELEPVEITYCSIEEYKELRDDFSRIDFQYPDNVQPLSPAIQELVEKIDNQK